MDLLTNLRRLPNGIKVVGVKIVFAVFKPALLKNQWYIFSMYDRLVKDRCRTAGTATKRSTGFGLMGMILVIGDR